MGLLNVKCPLQCLVVFYELQPGLRLLSRGVALKMSQDSQLQDPLPEYYYIKHYTWSESLSCKP